MANVFPKIDAAMAKTAGKPLDSFSDYIASVLGTRRWVVKPRLTARLRVSGYDRAVNQQAYTAIREEWEYAHGWAMGIPPELQPAWLRDAISAYMAARGARSS